MTAATLGVVVAYLLIAHSVADHWVQTGHQAITKGKPGRAGALACAAHVATYTGLATAVLVGLWWAADLDLTWAGVLAGQAISAASHYVADRREPLRRLAELVGKGEFWRSGAPGPGSGAYALDQAWHHGWIGVSALVTVLI